MADKVTCLKVVELALKSAFTVETENTLVTRTSRRFMNLSDKDKTGLVKYTYAHTEDWEAAAKHVVNTANMITKRGVGFSRPGPYCLTIILLLFFSVILSIFTQNAFYFGVISIINIALHLSIYLSNADLFAAKRIWDRRSTEDGGTLEALGKIEQEIQKPAWKMANPYVFFTAAVALIISLIVAMLNFDPLMFKKANAQQLVNELAEKRATGIISTADADLLALAAEKMGVSFDRKAFLENLPENQQLSLAESTLKVIKARNVNMDEEAELYLTFAYDMLTEDLDKLHLSVCAFMLTPQGLNTEYASRLAGKTLSTISYRNLTNKSSIACIHILFLSCTEEDQIKIMNRYFRTGSYEKTVELYDIFATKIRSMPEDTAAELRETAEKNSFPLTAFNNQN